MRTAREMESWDRLSYNLGTQSAFHGNKDVKIESFHKFLTGNNGLTAANMKQSTKHLFDKEK